MDVHQIGRKSMVTLRQKQSKPEKNTAVSKQNISKTLCAYYLFCFPAMLFFFMLSFAAQSNTKKLDNKLIDTFLSKHPSSFGGIVLPRLCV